MTAAKAQVVMSTSRRVKGVIGNSDLNRFKIVNEAHHKTSIGI
jgi:hypothetical protein